MTAAMSAVTAYLITMDGRNGEPNSHGDPGGKWCWVVAALIIITIAILSLYDGFTGGM